MVTRCATMFFYSAILLIPRDVLNFEYVLHFEDLQNFCCGFDTALASAKFTSKLPSDLSTLSLKTPFSFTSRPAMPLVKRLPFSTLGLELSISELFYRFNEAFRNSNCSIYSLLRVTLSQLDLQRQVSHEGGVSVYPYESLFIPIDSDRRDLTKTHPDNFKILIYIIESFGRFKHNSVDYISVIPSQLWKKPFFLTFSDLSSVVAWASNPVGWRIRSKKEVFPTWSIARSGCRRRTMDSFESTWLLGRWFYYHDTQRWLR